MLLSFLIVDQKLTSLEKEMIKKKNLVLGGLEEAIHLFVLKQDLILVQTGLEVVAPS